MFWHGDCEGVGLLFELVFTLVGVGRFERQEQGPEHDRGRNGEAGIAGYAGYQETEEATSWQVATCVDKAMQGAPAGQSEKRQDGRRGTPDEANSEQS